MTTTLKFLPVMLILLVGSSAIGQSRARHFTTLGPARNCESAMAQLDAFAIELQNDPTALGTIVTYGDRTKPFDSFFREAWIGRYLTKRIAGPGRVKLVRGEFRSEAKTEIWIVPAGADDPPIVDAKWRYELSGLTKPLKFGTTGDFGIVECDNYDFGVLVKFLEANQSMTVKAVFRETRAAKYRAAVKEFGDALAGKGIARDRLKASYVRVAGGKYLESTEFWLVPSSIANVKEKEIPQNSDRPTTDKPEGETMRDVFSGGVINGKATYLPKPAYPAAARAAKASGAVYVEVLVDEQGNVISAVAVSGDPLLRASAEEAAKGAKFSPTLLSGTPVKVKGVLVYNFQP